MKPDRSVRRGSFVGGKGDGEILGRAATLEQIPVGSIARKKARYHLDEGRARVHISFLQDRLPVPVAGRAKADEVVLRPLAFASPDQRAFAADDLAAASFPP